MATLLLAAAALGACVVGLPAQTTLLVLAGSLPLPLILRDFRAGVLLLALLLPVASMLPSLRGLNPLNFLTGMTLVSFALDDARRGDGCVHLPGAIFLGLVLPATWGIVIAWPHIPEGARNYPDLADAASVYDPVSYAVARFVKPFFYYLSFTFLLANAVRLSRRPERFMLLLGATLVVPALAVFYTVATYPGSIADVARDREFMAPRGMHANEFGMMFAAATGPLLFLAGGATRATWRWAARASVALATLALLLTFSRGGLTAFLVVVAGFLLHHRRLGTLAWVAVVAGTVWMAAPDSMKERFGTGLHAGAIGAVNHVEQDDLTAGRVHGWEQLAPEVLVSPMLGRGLGSTQWSTAVAAGAYKANHPHNIYLEILMDLGAVGLCAMAWLHLRYLWVFKRLAAAPSMPPDWQCFFAGARWSLLGMLVMAATTAYYMPNAAQFPFWFALGLCFAWWERAQTAPRAAGWMARRLGGALVAP